MVRPVLLQQHFSGLCRASRLCKKGIRFPCSQGPRYGPETDRQVAAPGEKIRALQIGRAPLPPLPFGQKTKDVLKYYQPSTRPPAEGEPAETDYLELIAHRARRKDLTFQRLQMWIDRKSALPVKIVGQEKDENVQTVELKDLKTNVDVEDELFELKKRPFWTEQTKHWEQGGTQ